MGDRLEALLRIPLAFVYGIIIGVWGLITILAVIIHWLYAIILGKRHRGIAEFTNRFVFYVYEAYRYLYLVTNERPWPIGKTKRTPSLPAEVD